MTITLNNCRIGNTAPFVFPCFSWKMNESETWLIIGPNGGGKNIFIEALAGKHEIVPQGDGYYCNSFSHSISFVSFEAEAALIEEERARDDSDFIEGGVDPGRTPRTLFIAAGITNEKIQDHPVITQCGLISILDRGLKYLSTGELRRCLLCVSIISKPALLIIDEPFEGLDVESSAHIGFLLDLLIKKSLLPNETRILLVLDRFLNVPNSITKVLEISNSSISFSGDRSFYEQKNTHREQRVLENKKDLLAELYDKITNVQSQGLQNLPETIRTTEQILVEMKNVTVAWSGNTVLDSLSWKLIKGEHWLIRGPNGSGKTTLLELITGANPQVFKNDISLFGSRRGSGETIWELKEKMGIVSYRLHLEYRSLGDLTLENVLLSGLHDTIGLYQSCGEEEVFLAEKWLTVCGFEGRGGELFREISYGEQRAILIARAAIKSPPLLILDEPCHGLDDEYRARILAILESIAMSGSSTLLHVTHDPTEQLACEKHILELHPGEKPMYTIISLV